MTDTSENLRAQMVREAIETHGGPITIERLAPFLPIDFELGADDLAPHLPEQTDFVAPPPPSALGDYLAANKSKAEPEGSANQPRLADPTEFEPEAEPDTASLMDIEPAKPTRDLSAALARLDHKNPKHWMADGRPQLDMIRAFLGDRSITSEMVAATGYVRKRAPEPKKFTDDEISAAVARLTKAERDVAEARTLQINEDRTEKELNAKLSAAVTQFQNGFKPLSPEQLKKQYVAEQQNIRAAIARGEMPGRPGPKIGKSVVDRNAYYSRSTNPAHGDYRRGAFPSSARGRSVAPKVPSEA